MSLSPPDYIVLVRIAEALENLVEISNEVLIHMRDEQDRLIEAVMEDEGE